MKKILFGTAVAALAMLSACETLAPVDGAPSGSISGAGSATGSEQVTLTATIGSDTKTYLEWDGRVFKTRWAEGDEIMVLDNRVDYTKNDLEDHYGWFELTAGAGESTAEFTLGEGILPESYVAAYGDVWPNETTGEYMMWISTHQYRMLYETKSGELIQGFDSFRYPMVAEATGTSCTFRNLCAVLKLSLTGNGELLKNVYVSSLDEGVYLAGDAILDLTASRPTLRFSPEDVVYTDIEFEPRYYDEENDGYVDEYLSSDPVECYIVLPAQTYPSGLKITIETENGLMEVETEDNLVLEQSELREIPVLEYESTLSWDFWDIESLEDGTEIKVNGTVYAAYEDGFIIVLGGEYALFVACSDLDVSMGQNIDIYGVKATVNGMPVVTGVVSTFFVNSLDINLYFNNITTDFAWWSSSIYSNIRYVGIYSAATNTVTVEGVEDKLGRVIKQNQDYSALDGQRVVVDGYSAGMEYSADGSMTYLNTIVVRMAKVEGSSTEDVVPGDELPII